MVDEESKVPRNRKERRAAAKESGRPVERPSSMPKVNSESIPLGQPDRSGPKSKTLLDIYNDKKALIEQGQPFDIKHQDGRVRDESGNILTAGQAGHGDHDEPIGPTGNTVFWTFTLGMLHTTLDTLVFSQYRQEIEWGSIFRRTGTALPILFSLIYITRIDMVERKFKNVKQVIFFVVAVATGCYTIHVSNRYDYFAVMKQAPPLGTLWIWSVIEMDLAFAAASIAVNLVYLYWKGYSVA
nr:hypothetical protein CFP56_03228 [Quercus suber]